MIEYDNRLINEIVGKLEADRLNLPLRPIDEAFDESVFKCNPMDVEMFIKKNNLQEVTNPIFFVKNGMPTEDGLLSNTIFGTTKSERATHYAYIDLGDTYMHPLCYKIWTRMDKRVIDIAHGTKRFKVVNGDFVEDPNGETGIEFIKKHIKEIKIRTTDSRIRDKRINFIDKVGDRMFMTKLIVLPAYYRDVDNTGSRVGVGAINKIYAQIIAMTKAIRDTRDYGFGLDESSRGRIQDAILNIYNTISGNNGGDPTAGTGLSKKRGYVKMSVLSKTSDYGCRLVISSPDLKVERVDDMMVDMYHCGLPLAAALVNFHPFILFHIRQFFENNFYGNKQLPMIDQKTKEISYVSVTDPEAVFNEDMIREEINRFIHGYSARFRPLKIPCSDGKERMVAFTGRYLSPEDYKKGNTIGNYGTVIHRPLTWCDILFMAATEAVKGRHVIITRYPMDRCFNSIMLECYITTIKETEGVYVDGRYYRWYPKIEMKDIDTNTSNKFVDSLVFNNTLISGAGADYDGDQVSVQGVWTEEANAEIAKFMRSKANYINNNGQLVRDSEHSSIQVMYSMTFSVVDENKLEAPTF